MISKYIIQIAELIANGKENQEIKDKIAYSQEEIKNEINIFLTDRDAIIQIVNILFPHCIPICSEFYKRLQKLQSLLQFDEPSDKLIGFIWIESFKILSNDDQYKLLQIYVDNKDFDFWSLIEAVPTFLSEKELSADFATNWFLKFGKKVENDVTGSYFYKAVENYSFSFPRTSLKIFEKYYEINFKDLRLNIAAKILGAIRSSATEGRIEKSSIEKSDRKLRSSLKTEIRLCYYRSLITSFQIGTLEINRLKIEVERMCNGTEKEVEEAFNVIHQCNMGRVANNKLINLGYALFSGNHNI